MRCAVALAALVSAVALGCANTAPASGDVDIAARRAPACVADEACSAEAGVPTACELEGEDGEVASMLALPARRGTGTGIWCRRRRRSSTTCEEMYPTWTGEPYDVVMWSFPVDGSKKQWTGTASFSGQVDDNGDPSAHGKFFMWTVDFTRGYSLSFYCVFLSSRSFGCIDAAEGTLFYVFSIPNDAVSPSCLVARTNIETMRGYLHIPGEIFPVTGFGSVNRAAGYHDARQPDDSKPLSLPTSQGTLVKGQCSGYPSLDDKAHAVVGSVFYVGNRSTDIPATKQMEVTERFVDQTDKDGKPDAHGIFVRLLVEGDDDYDGQEYYCAFADGDVPILQCTSARSGTIFKRYSFVIDPETCLPSSFQQVFFGFFLGPDPTYKETFMGRLAPRSAAPPSPIGGGFPALVDVAPFNTTAHDYGTNYGIEGASVYIVTHEKNFIYQLDEDGIDDPAGRFVYLELTSYGGAKSVTYFICMFIADLGMDSALECLASSDSSTYHDWYNLQIDSKTSALNISTGLQYGCGAIKPLVHVSFDQPNGWSGLPSFIR